MPGYMVDAESMARLGKMLLAYESGNLASIAFGGAEQESGNSAPIVHPVRVTSSTPDAYGTYPGKLLRYYPGTNTYYDHSNIRIRDVNGEVPSVKRFLGRLGGYTSGNEVLYLIQISAAVGSESGSVGSSSGSGSGSEYYSVSGSIGSVSGSAESGSVGSVSGSVSSGSVGSVSGSAESGSVGSGSAASGSQPCGGSGSLQIEVVTNVQCIDGSIVVTKQTISIPGGVIC